MLLKILEPFWENIQIYCENVSYFYILCISVSLVAVGLSWSGERKLRPAPSPVEETSNDQEESREDENAEISPPQMSKKTLLENASQSMTKNDLKQEKEIEKQQLANIFELIQKDREKFQIDSLQELEEQMKLYRS